MVPGPISVKWRSRSAAISASAARGGDRSWPVGGGSLQDVGMATPRAISFAPAADGKQMIGHTGQSSTQVVIMTRSARVLRDHPPG